MGIKHLNKFLRENCSKKSIYKIHLSSLKGKTVVIDTSIYLYKFISENALLENFYLFISILLHYGIIPIFIFDGKPPAEKKALLIQRLLEKKDAEAKYNTLLSSSTEEMNMSEKNEMEHQLKDLKKQFIRVQSEDIEKVKALMDAYGVVHYDATGEADELCAFFMKTEKAWACFSDDMDMLVYEKSTYVIRNLSLLNHTAFLYDKSAIMHDLEMTEIDFNQIMILSGTDYNIHSNTSLKETIRWFHEYNKYRASTETNHQAFYTWLSQHTKYITNLPSLMNTTQLFCSKEHPEFEKTKIQKTVYSINTEKLKTVLYEEGFLFL